MDRTMFGMYSLIFCFSILQLFPNVMRFREILFSATRHDMYAQMRKSLAFDLSESETRTLSSDLLLYLLSYTLVVRPNQRCDIPSERG